MRENRTYGSEGGEGESPSLPLSPNESIDEAHMRCNALSPSPSSGQAYCTLRWLSFDFRALTSIARGVLSTEAAINAPCSVKANGSVEENLSLARWSQFVTTSSFSLAAIFRSTKPQWRQPKACRPCH